MKATEDFLETALYAHILTAAKQIIKTTDKVGDCNMVAKSLVEQFVKVSLPCDEALLHEMTCNDFVHAYAVDFLTTGLLWQGFRDAIRCGDGNRILTYWKFLIVIFKNEHHHNYAKEGFLLLAQSLVLSARKTAELKWCRTVNTHGRAGKNIPIDLHMEHLNCQLKDMIRNLGSNRVCSVFQSHWGLFQIFAPILKRQRKSLLYQTFIQGHLLRKIYSAVTRTAGERAGF